MAYDYPAAFFAPRDDRVPGAAPATRNRAGARRCDLRDAQTAADRRGRRRALQRRHRCAAQRSPSSTASRSPRRRPARARCRGIIRCSTGAIGVTGSPAANALAHDADVVLAVGTRLSGLHDRLAYAVRAGDARRPQRERVRRAQDGAASRVVADARPRSPRCRARSATGAPRRTGPRRAQTARRRAGAATSARITGTRDVKALPYEGEVIGAVQRSADDSADARHRRLRGGHAAGRAAQAVAHGGARRLSRRIRLLVHGLRDRRRPRREDGAAGARGHRDGRRRQLSDDELRDRDLGDARREARSSSCSTTAATAASTGCSRPAAARRSTTCSPTACRATTARRRSTSPRTPLRSARWPSTSTNDRRARSRAAAGPRRGSNLRDLHRHRSRRAPPKRAAGGGKSRCPKSRIATRCAGRARAATSREQAGAEGP